MNEQTHESSNNVLSYVLGGILVVAVIAGGYFLKPKSATTPSGDQSAVPTANPTPGMIAKLSCDTQYYNPVIGFNKYYLSVEGSDVEGVNEVTCTTTVTQENKVIATEKTTVPLSANPTRGGLVFKCSTPALELKPTIPTKVDIKLENDRNDTATCSTLFALPKP